MDLSKFSELVALDHGLSVVSTLRADGSVQSTVVNAGVLPHPVDAQPVVAFVARGDARKVGNLRRDPRVTIVVRAGWRWAAVEGDAEVIGPDAGATPLASLLRDVFRAAGGTHEDWGTFDRVMAEERRVAVLVAPRRTSGDG